MCNRLQSEKLLRESEHHTIQLESLRLDKLET